MWQELQHTSAPLAVREWLASKPQWLSVETGGPRWSAPLPQLDLGECEAIALAESHLPDALLLIDEEKGRNEAL